MPLISVSCFESVSRAGRANCAHSWRPLFEESLRTIRGGGAMLLKRSEESGRLTDNEESLPGGCQTRHLVGRARSKVKRRTADARLSVSAVSAHGVVKAYEDGVRTEGLAVTAR